MVRESMISSEEIIDITFPCRRLLFSQSCCDVSANLSDVGGLAIGAIDLINFSLSVLRFVLVFDVC